MVDLLKAKHVVSHIIDIADKLIMETYNTGTVRALDVANQEIVTACDVAVETIIVDCLKSKYPDHNIIGEETQGVNTGSDYTWLIDPIDGSFNFFRGLPFFSVSVSLIHCFIPLIGIVSAPALGMRFWSVKGKGAYLNNNKINVSDAVSLNKAVLSTGFYLACNDNPNNDYFSKLINHIHDIRRYGSAALELCFVAAGKLDGHWEFGLADYDFKAGELILTESGGRLSEYNVENSKLIIASNGHLHQEMVDQLVNTRGNYGKD